MLAFILANKLALVTILFAISEGLAMIPSIQANGIFQAIFNALKGLKAQLSPPQS